MSFINKIRNLSTKDKIVYKNAAGAFLIKGLALIVSLFTMPAYIRFFADEQILGVWFTILSVLTWILNFDIGIGNGLRNKLSAVIALGDYKRAKEYISSSYFMIGAVVVVVSVLGNILIPFVNWNSVFNISIDLIPDRILLEVIRYVFIGIMLQFFLRLVSSILYAIQKSAVNNLIALITSVLQLSFALLAPSLTPTENLKMFSIAHIFCSNIPLLIVSIILFLGPLRKCRPNIKCLSKEKAKNVLSLGGIFFACQILYMIIVNTNEFFISQYTEPGNVVDYQIYNKLFSLGSVVFMLALTPVWSAVSKAMAEKDYIWLSKLYKNIKRLAFLGIIAEFMIIPFLQIIINIWLSKDAIKVNYAYAFCFAAFGAVMIFQSAISTIVNGTGRMKIQAICYTCAVIAKFAIIHFGFIFTDSWLIIVLATVIVVIPYCVVQYIDLNRYFNRLKNHSDGSNE